MKTRFQLAAIVVLACLMPSCRNAIEFQPRQADDGWPLSDPQRQGIDPEKVDAAYGEAGRLDNIYSLLVVKNGFLVAEKYFNGRDIDMASSTASVTKSFTSALAGRLIASL
jgi:CubicO group peptidase (beta-lactamase class C family)